jgi:hypothetical protein
MAPLLRGFFLFWVYAYQLFGGSEPAREKRRDNAGIQTARVIVTHHRERACSYRVCAVSVGASLLAKNAGTTRAFRQPVSSLSTIASGLAPTGGGVAFFQMVHHKAKPPAAITEEMDSPPKQSPPPPKRYKKKYDTSFYV